MTNNQVVSDMNGPGGSQRWSITPAGGFGGAVVGALAQQGGDGSQDVTALPDKLAVLGQAAAGKLPDYSPAAAAAAAGKLTGATANMGAGANDAITGFLGAPVDLATGALNLIPRGINAVAGTNLPTIQNPIGGSDSFKSLFGVAGLDPRNVVPTDGLDTISRAAGQGIAGTVLPGAMARGLVGAGVTTAGTLGDTFLRSFAAGSPGNLAVVGGAGGAGGEIAAQNVPEPYRPLVSFLGNMLAGGVVAGGYAGVKAAGQAAIEGMRKLVAPLTPTGQRQLAGTALVNASSGGGERGLVDPLTGARYGVDEAVSGGRSGLLDALDQPEAGELVPGSQPTTFQATGDLGIGGLERSRANANPEPFLNRRADQNAARVNALGELAPDWGRPQIVGDLFKRHLAAMDEANDAAIGTAQRRATNLLGEVGGNLEKNEYGSSVRQSLEDAKSEVKKAEAAKWNAIDPTGSLAVDVSPVTKAAKEIPASMSASARALEGEEAAIFKVAQGYRGVVPFRELGDLRSRVLAEIRAQRIMGESPSLRRLTMLRQAIDEAMAQRVAHRAEELAPHPPRGVAPVQGVNAPSTGSRVYTPSGRPIDIRHELVDLAGPNPPLSSHDMHLRPHPAYPRELQPRDRTRAVSATQIADIAANLQPERLMASPSVAEGAPVVGPDNMVESGNARTLALAKAYREGTPQAQAYRAALEAQGFNTKGMAAPMLIRRRLTDLSPADRARFVQEANAGSGLAMSSTERASQDASRLSDNVMSLYRGDSDLGSAANNDFVRAFIQSVPDKSEIGAFVTPERELSLEGRARINAALLQKAYDNGGLVRALTETGDENLRSFGGGLSDAAGDFAKLRGEIAAGRVEPSMDISSAINEAASIVQMARSKGIPLRDALAQQDAFRRVSPIAETFLKSIYGEDLAGRVSRSRVGDILKFYVEDAGKQSTEARLFGSAALPQDILTAARGRYGTAEGTPVVRNPPSEESGAGNAGGGQEGRGSGSAAPGPSTRGGAGQRQPVLDEVPLTANFDEAAAARYRAAAEATREKKQTYGTGAVGQVLQAGRNGVPYGVADSQVAGKFFNKGPKALEDVQGFIRAVGGNGRAVDVLQDYAANRLRDFAERSDGTLDPAKVAKFVEDHHDALRAFPALAEKFRNVGEAQSTVDDMIAARARDRDLLEKGAAQHFLGDIDPLIAVDRAFRTLDPANTFEQLARAISGNPEAKAGLQAAVRDYIKQKFISNTEAGTSGVELLKSDQLRTFVKKNINALRWVFSPDQIAGMEAIAADLQRSNRSIVSSKLPGQSNTVQDLAGAQKHSGGTGFMANLGKAAGHGGNITTLFLLEQAGEHFGGGHLGITAMVGGYFGKALVEQMRAAGLQSVNALVDKALLDPVLARALVLPINPSHPGTVNMAMAQFTAALRRLAVVGTVNSANQEMTNRKQAQ